jgi:hypothetical protein
MGLFGAARRAARDLDLVAADDLAQLAGQQPVGLGRQLGVFGADEAALCLGVGGGTVVGHGGGLPGSADQTDADCFRPRRGPR